MLNLTIHQISNVKMDCMRLCHEIFSLLWGMKSLKHQWHGDHVFLNIVRIVNSSRNIFIKVVTTWFTWTTHPAHTFIFLSCTFFTFFLCTYPPTTHSPLSPISIHTYLPAHPFILSPHSFSAIPSHYTLSHFSHYFIHTYIHTYIPSHSLILFPLSFSTHTLPSHNLSLLPYSHAHEHTLLSHIFILFYQVPNGQLHQNL